MKRRMAVWAMAAAVLVAWAGAAVAESVEQLLAAGRLHEAAAMWNAGEREGAGMILERLSAEKWPEEVRAKAAAASEAYDAQWSTMPGGGQAEHEPLGQRIAERLQARGWPVEGTIAAISLLPIVELRGAIPVGHVLIGDEDRETHFGREDWARAGKVFLWAVVGNLLPIPFILWLLGPLSGVAMKWGPGRRFFEWLFARTRRKTADIEKYEFWGLALFVAVPLPVTGAWTGAMAGWLLGIPFWQALASIAIGVCAAGCIMTALSLMGWVGLAIALAALVVVFGGGTWRAVRKK